MVVKRFSKKNQKNIAFFRGFLYNQEKGGENMDLIALRARKKELKLTNEDIANLSGIPKRTVEDIFRGKTEHPRIDTMQAIERALGLENEKSPTDELSEGEKALLELFRTATEEQQALALQLLRVALSRK